LLIIEESYILVAGRIVFTELTNIERIGCGGFGTVWKAEWTPGKKVVAIKKVQEIVEREVGHSSVIHLANIINCYM